jgi:ferric-dicitrate binding protein FerR (iron transport regulator)
MKEDGKHPMDDRDDVAKLVRLGGKRRSVPHERAERVRAAAQAQWQEEVRRRSRRRYVWTAAALATAASLVLAITLTFIPFGSDDPTGSGATILVEALNGSAWSRLGAEANLFIAVGDNLRPGSALATAEESRAAIRLASGHSVRLDASTQIRLLDNGSLAVDRGAVYVDSGEEATTTKALDVHTPLGVIEEIGTQFEVRLANDSVRVRLREGTVVVHQDDRNHELQVGTELELNPDGSVTRRALPTHGAEWEWVVGITPMLDLEGRTAMAFLEWVARERGWTLAFADDSVARFAGETVLGGALERLTLDEALDAVLPTCQMTYHVQSGVLVVAATPAGPSGA